MKADTVRVVICCSLMAVGCGSSKPAEVITFERACATPALRAAYVESLVRKNDQLPEYVLGIEYVDDEALAARWPAVAAATRRPGMLTIPEGGLGAWIGDGGNRSTVLVLSPSMACGLPGGEPAFQLGIFDHELEHARIAWAGPASLGITSADFGTLDRGGAAWLVHTLGELQAYRHELEAAEARELPEDYRRIAYGAYLEYFLGLLSPPVELPQELHERLLIAWFAPWFFSRVPILNRGGDEWFFDTGEQELLIPPAVRAAVEQAPGEPL